MVYAQGAEPATGEARQPTTSLIAGALQSFLMVALIGGLYMILMSLGIIDAEGNLVIGADYTTAEMILETAGSALERDIESALIVVLGSCVAVYAQMNNRDSSRNVVRFNAVASLL